MGRGMNEPHLFWTIFAATLSAIMLGGMFFWGLIAYSRKEREGTQNSVGGNLIFICVMMPMLFCLGGMMIALDATPAWLNAILQ